LNTSVAEAAGEL